MAKNEYEKDLVFVPCPYCHTEDYDVVATGRDFEFETSEKNYQFVSCKECGLLRLNPRPNITDLNNIYPKEYNCYHIETFYHPLLNIIRLFFQKRIVSDIKKLCNKQALILDVGCGSGELLLLLRKYGSKNWNLAGNDITDASKGSLIKHNIDFIKGRFEDLNFHRGDWDVIILQGVIEHLDDPDKVIKGAYRMLKKGGYLMLITPSSESWDARLFKSKYWAQWHFPRHWVIYNPTLIKMQLIKNGFSQININPLLSPWSWIQSLHNYFVNKNKKGIMTKIINMNNALLILLFSLVNLIQILLTNNSANMKIIAKKNV